MYNPKNTDPADSSQLLSRPVSVLLLKFLQMRFARRGASNDTHFAYIEMKIEHATFAQEIHELIYYLPYHHEK